jgi:rubredoxin
MRGDRLALVDDDEVAGIPGGMAPGTPMSDLPGTWRCPDCGTDVGKFQPYRGMG